MKERDRFGQIRSGIIGRLEGRELKKEIKTIANQECYIYDCGSSDVLLIQPVDDHDIEVLDSEVAEICRLVEGNGFSPKAGKGFTKVAGNGFTLAAFKVNDWNDDLSPWEAPPVFGDHGFGGNAEETLKYVTEELIPALTDGSVASMADGGSTGLTGGEDGSMTGSEITKLYIGGYSLAAFFALWAAYQTDVFSGVAAASPSVWFPGWIDYAEKNPVRAEKIYLSLGDKEEKTRNQVMRIVGDNIRRQYELLQDDTGCCDCTLEMNPGNHFKEPDIRTAKGFAWLLNN
jgi:predicted alpha/beta superfamily hydrolase